MKSTETKAFSDYKFCCFLYAKVYNDYRYSFKFLYYLIPFTAN